MKRFADLFDRIDATTSTLRKIDAMAAYFEEAPAEDAAWAVFFLTGRTFKRLVSSRDLRRWALEKLSMPEWIYEESYIAVGDTAETVALLLDAGRPDRISLGLAAWVRGELLPLQDLDEPARRARIWDWWETCSGREIFLANKLLTGALRVGVSQTMVEKALARWTGQAPTAIAHRLMGEWTPDPAFIERLKTAAADTRVEEHQPYPFFLASPLEAGERPGEVSEWLFEWKWDGIRAQVVRRGEGAFLWSRGEELVNERFPELLAAAQTLPSGTVLDGEILAYQEGRPLPFAALQKRIGRKRLTPKILAEIPVVLMAYDCLEHEGRDIRERPLAERRAILALLLSHPRFLLSPAHEPASWDDAARLRETSRVQGVEGLMLKRRSSPYRVGRRRGDWWKWKVEPHVIDAVLIYAQAGSGKRANLFTDYTFAVWREQELVPVAKAYSGLTDAEIAQLDHWIRANTLERFGPVRSVKAAQVFELGFEGIAHSTRHKSGVALRFPRILRWRSDKKIEDADTLQNLKRLIHAAV